MLHNRGEVAESTKKKILKILKELDYHPNFLASALASKKSALFATLLPEPPSPEGYWTRPAVGIRKRVSELRQYGIRVQPFTFSQTEPESFEENAQKILELNPDGVVLAPFFKKESLAFISKLKKINVPFVFIDSEIKNAGQLGYIGQNSYQSGLVSGKLLDMLMPVGNILVIHFAKEMDNQNHLVQREKGFYDWYSTNNQKSHRLFTVEVPDTSDEMWMERLVEKIHEKNIRGIFVTNSRVFHVAHLIEKHGLNELKVIGHDLIKENVAGLKKDLVHFLICQRPEEQGYRAIDKVFRHVVQKRNLPGDNYTSIDIITKENVDYYKEFK